MKICGIYGIASPTGGMYIGQSIEMLTRWSFHKRMHGNQPKLYNSFKKHGVDKHQFFIITTLSKDVDSSVLTNYEQFCIDQYREAGYKMLNLKEAGNNGRCSDETKLRMSESKKGKPTWNKGIPATEEAKIKMSISRKKWKITEETGNKISIALKGRVKSESHKEKIRLVNLGKKASEETKKKMSLTRKGKYGKKLSEQTKEKIRQKQFGRSKTKEEVEKWRASMKQMMERRKNNNGSV